MVCLGYGCSTSKKRAVVAPATVGCGRSCRGSTARAHPSGYPPCGLPVQGCAGVACRGVLRPCVWAIGRALDLSGLVLAVGGGFLGIGTILVLGSASML